MINVDDDAAQRVVAKVLARFNERLQQLGRWRARVTSPFHPLPSFGRAALGLKGSVERGVVALQQGRRVADGRSLVNEAMPKGDLVG